MKKRERKGWKTCKNRELERVKGRNEEKQFSIKRKKKAEMQHKIKISHTSENVNESTKVE